jgi:hypothetical protein
VRASRRTQHYRQGRAKRPPGPALDAMRRGKPQGMANPMDLKRKLAKRHGSLARKLARLRRV